MGKTSCKTYVCSLFFIKMLFYVNDNRLITDVGFCFVLMHSFPKVLMVIMVIPKIMMHTEHLGMIFQALQSMSLVLSQQDWRKDS